VSRTSRERERGKKLALLGPPVGNWDIMPEVTRGRAKMEGTNRDLFLYTSLKEG
jgi:hypothetical protein